MSLKLNFKKTSEDFDTLVQEMVVAYPELKEFVGEAPYSIECVISKLALAIKHNPPSVFNEEFPATLALNVSATQLSFKTKKFLSFGWYVNADGENVSYDFRITVFTRNPLTKKGPAAKSLQDMGWNMIVRDNDQVQTKKAECEPSAE